MYNDVFMFIQSYIKKLIKSGLLKTLWAIRGLIWLYTCMWILGLKAVLYFHETNNHISKLNCMYVQIIHNITVNFINKLNDIALD